MAEGTVSIVIPTRNGARTLPAVLAAIRRQRGATGAAGEGAPGAIELIGVDSGSTDNSRSLLRDAGARILRISPREFDHGLTRNLGVEAARGDPVILLVQDAIPASDGWLAALARPLQGDAQVAGAFARQVPPPLASRLARRMLSRWVAAGDEPRHVRLEPHQSLAALDPDRRLERCTFDNVCSCISREVWRRHPFPAASFAEDLEWGRTVLEAGYTLVFAPEAVVRHAHDRGWRYELRRTWVAHQRLHHLFGLHTVPSLRALPRAVASTFVDHADCLLHEPGPRPEPREVLRCLGLSVVWPVGQYLGGRAAHKGWPSPPRGPV